MTDVLHKVLPPEEGHVIQSPPVADYAALLALTVTDADVGRVVQLLDAQTYYILNKVQGGVVWTQIDAVGATQPQLDLIDDLRTDLDQLRTPGGDPTLVQDQAADVGTSTAAARADHKHPVLFGLTTEPIGAVADPGNDVALARADHVHTLSAADRARLDASGPPTPLTDTPPAEVNAYPGIAGTGTEASRVDHRHQVLTEGPVPLQAGNGAVTGNSDALSRADHRHDMPVGEPLPIGATLATGTSLLFARADHVHTLDPADRAKIDGTTQVTSAAPADVTKAAAAVGTSTAAARADHKHDVSTAAPTVIGTGAATVAEGSSSALARADHVHVLDPLDRAKLDAAGPSTPLSSFVPVDVNAYAGSVGVGASAARHDHRHQVQTDVPIALQVGAANDAGSSDALSRADHKHQIPTATPVAIGPTLDQGNSLAFARADHVHTLNTTDRARLDGAALLTTSAPADVSKSIATVGVATDAARADHKHNVETAAPVAVGNAASEGVSSSLARADHVHPHGAQTDPAHHAVATTTTAGFLSAADKVRIDNIAAAGFAVVSSAAPAPVFPQTASAGTSPDAARADHKHDVATDAPVAIAVAGNAGVASSLSRSDHVHPHGDLTGGSLHALATGGSAGFMSSAQFTQLSNTAPIAPTNATMVAIASAGSAGTTNQCARVDHTHAHGNLPGNTLHDVASQAIAGFMSATDKQKLDGLSNVSIDTATTPTTSDAGAASAGSGTAAAAVNHKHTIAVGTPVAVGAANAAGSSNNLARADHVHDASNKADILYTVVTNATSTRTLSASDSGKLIAFTFAGAATLTIPKDATTTLPTGFTCTVVGFDAAAVVTVASETATGTYGIPARYTAVYSDAGTTPRTIYGAAFQPMTITKVAADSWLVSGGYVP